MVIHSRTNYPEDFNDYVDINEHLALIDMIVLGKILVTELIQMHEKILRISRT